MRSKRVVECDSRLFTIGYEGRSIADYLGILRANQVRMVVDVRRNPLSRKKGFSKRALSESLAESGIAYAHIPELGIDSSLRKNLVTDQDYTDLFSHYEEVLLPSCDEAVDRLASLIRDYGSVALTCFERDADRCHRHCVASNITKRKKCPDLAVHL